MAAMTATPEAVLILLRRRIGSSFPLSFGVRCFISSEFDGTLLS